MLAWAFSLFGFSVCLGFFLFLLLFLIHLCKESQRQQSIQDLVPLLQCVHLDPLGDLYLWVLGPSFSEDVFRRPV